MQSIDCEYAFVNLHTYMHEQIIRSVEVFLISAHISYGKGKYLNQTGFFLQSLPSTKFIFNFEGVTYRIQLT